MPLRQVLNLKIERYNALKFSESVPSLHLVAVVLLLNTIAL